MAWHAPGERDETERDGSERGASLVEYALLVALIALVCIAAVGLLGTSTGAQYSSVLTGFG